MKRILNSLFDHQKLSVEQAREVLIKISKEEYNPAEVASFITVYLMRGISLEELKGFRDALIELAIPLDVRGQSVIDLCGTGGDGKNTFNISTLASFVVAGAGYKVVKHGNYGVSSVSGSSNVLESLGYSFTNDNDTLLRELDRSNICFCHAPLFHPALKGVGPIRRQLRVKTFFNMLGPLVNPARPNHQLVGVFNLKIAKLYKYLFENDAHDYAIVHSLDGYDEVSLTGKTLVLKPEEERLMYPHEFDARVLKQEEIFGGDTIEEAVSLFKDIIQNKGTEAQEKVVLANAALAIQTFDRTKDILTCQDEAREALKTGAAFQALNNLLKN